MKESKQAPRDPSPAQRQGVIQKKAPGIVQMLKSSSFEEGAGMLRPQKSPGGGSKIPERVKADMEQSLGADFSNVRIHQGSESARAMGALAYTRGTDIHFAPGQWNPGTKAGDELLKHELIHVKQQDEGRVKPSDQLGGMPFNADASLEHEADHGGHVTKSKPTVNPSGDVTQGRLLWNFDKVKGDITTYNQGKSSQTQINEDGLVEKVKGLVFESAKGQEIWGEFDGVDKPDVEIVVTNTGGCYASTPEPLGMLEKDILSAKTMSGAKTGAKAWVIWNMYDQSEPKNAETNWTELDDGFTPQSSITGLLHELGHVRQSTNSDLKDEATGYLKKSKHKGDLYNELYELHNLLHHEVDVSLELGEITRSGYSDADTSSLLLDDITGLLGDIATRKAHEHGEDDLDSLKSQIKGKIKEKMAFIKEKVYIKEQLGDANYRKIVTKLTENGDIHDFYELIEASEEIRNYLVTVDKDELDDILETYTSKQSLYSDQTVQYYEAYVGNRKSGKSVFVAFNDADFDMMTLT